MFPGNRASRCIRELMLYFARRVTAKRALLTAGVRERSGLRTTPPVSSRTVKFGESTPNIPASPAFVNADFTVDLHCLTRNRVRRIAFAHYPVVTVDGYRSIPPILSVTAVPVVGQCTTVVTEGFEISPPIVLSRERGSSSGGCPKVSRSRLTSLTLSAAVAVRATLSHVEFSLSGRLDSDATRRSLSRSKNACLLSVRDG
ncbi:hypothetical protein F5Y01DRAFT_259142 [Xylaria sp. FL0043]|nr:hypothetical protein F5Y01DRAFT_259142 [Xylaria sp. FL0043]